MKKYELTRLPVFRPESVHIHEPDPPPSLVTVSSRCVVVAVCIVLLSCILFAIGGYVLGKSEFENVIFKSLDSAKAAIPPKPMEHWEPTAEELRLPGNLLPIVYRLDMRVFLPYKDSLNFGQRNFTFDASLQIDFECVRPTSLVVLNAKQLIIEQTSVHLADATGNNLTLGFMRDRRELEMVEFWFITPMIVGQRYTISFEYSGPIAGDTLAGLYRSKYIENNSVKWLAVTQMQPTDARRMLPCFDEPEMKARFELIVRHPMGTKAISNAIEIVDAELENEDWSITRFEPSPKMSSYLLAVAVSEFGYKQTITSRGVRMRVWARPSRLDQTDYALSIGPKLLAYYEDYFGIKYPLKKQDMIALPDFGAGAMENWGLITYREKYVLYDHTIYSLKDRQRITNIIAHELAHMWFGDLVTMKWWDDIWLNEGFATFMATLGSDYIENTTVRKDEIFILESIQRAMRSDQLIATTHPLSTVIEKANEVQEIFDIISYNKGAAVLHMIRRTIGDDVFQAGLSAYLKRHSYANADRNDLWSSLSSALTQNGSIPGWNDEEPFDFTAFADSWTQQLGYPVVSVSRTNDGAITVRQELFKLNKNAVESERFRGNPLHFIWKIPIQYRTGFELQSETSVKWLADNKEVRLLPSDSWVLLNPYVDGFYRVEYDQKTWDLLIDVLMLEHETIPVSARSQLLDDAFTLAESGRIDYNVPLKMSHYLTEESDYAPWATALGHFERIELMLRSKASYGDVQQFLINLMIPAYERIWNVTVLNDNQLLLENLQALLVGRLCGLGYQPCIERSKLLFSIIPVNCPPDMYISSPHCNVVNPSLRHTVYCTAIEHGSRDEWDFLLGKYVLEPYSIELDRIFAGLSCSRKQWKISYLLDDALLGEAARPQDVKGKLYEISRKPLGGRMLWDYVRTNWNVLYARYKQMPGTVQAILQYSTESFTSDYEADQLTAFRNDHPELEMYAIIDRQLEAARIRANWLKQHSRTVALYFSVYKDRIEYKARLVYKDHVV